MHVGMHAGTCHARLLCIPYHVLLHVHAALLASGSACLLLAHAQRELLCMTKGNSGLGWRRQGRVAPDGRGLCWVPLSNILCMESYVRLTLGCTPTCRRCGPCCTRPHPQRLSSATSMTRACRQSSPRPRLRREMYCCGTQHRDVCWPHRHQHNSQSWEVTAIGRLVFNGLILFCTLHQLHSLVISRRLLGASSPEGAKYHLAHTAV